MGDLILDGLKALSMVALLLIFIYIAARLGSLGAARSWWEFKKQHKEEEGENGSQNQKQ